jgi:hypothetical protein
VPYAREVEKDNEFATKAKTWGIKNESAAVEVYAALRLNKSIMPNHTYHVLLVSSPTFSDADSLFVA